MKKVFIFLTIMGLAFSFAPKAAAQDNPFAAGNIMIGAYTGLPTQFSNLRIPPIGITGEYGIIDFGGGEWGTLAAGGAFDLCLHRDYDSHHHNWRYQASAFAAYHYFFNESLEVHAKSGLGWFHFNVADYRYNTIGFYDFIGASYFVSPALALTTEVGWSGVAFMHLGANIVF